MGPLMPSETDLQFFLIFLLVYRFDPVRDMGKGGWSEKSEGKGKTKARRHWRPLIVDSRPCYQTVQTHQALRNTAPHSKSECDHDFAFQGDVFSLWRHLSQLRG